MRYYLGQTDQTGYGSEPGTASPPAVVPKVTVVAPMAQPKYSYRLPFTPMSPVSAYRGPMAVPGTQIRGAFAAGGSGRPEVKKKISSLVQKDNELQQKLAQIKQRMRRPVSAAEGESYFAEQERVAQQQAQLRNIERQLAQVREELVRTRSLDVPAAQMPSVSRPVEQPSGLAEAKAAVESFGFDLPAPVFAAPREAEQSFGVPGLSLQDALSFEMDLAAAGAARGIPLPSPVGTAEVLMMDRSVAPMLEASSYDDQHAQRMSSLRRGQAEAEAAAKGTSIEAVVASWSPEYQAELYPDAWKGKAPSSPDLPQASTQWTVADIMRSPIGSEIKERAMQGGLSEESANQLAIEGLKAFSEMSILDRLFNSRKKMAEKLEPLGFKLAWKEGLVQRKIATGVVKAFDESLAGRALNATRVALEQVDMFSRMVRKAVKSLDEGAYQTWAEVGGFKDAEGRAVLPEFALEYTRSNERAEDAKAYRLVTNMEYKVRRMADGMVPLGMVRDGLPEKYRRSASMVKALQQAVVNTAKRFSGVMGVEMSEFRDASLPSKRRWEAAKRLAARVREAADWQAAEMKAQLTWAAPAIAMELDQ